MGLLPIDEWVYHLDFKRDEVNRKHQEVVNTENTVQSRVLLFNTQLNQYKLLLANNAILLYIDKTVRMNDLQLKDFTVAIAELEPPVKGDIVLNSLITYTELIGKKLVLKFLANLKKVIKERYWTDSESAEGLDEDVVENLADESFDSGIVDSESVSSTESLEDVEEEVTEAVVEDATSAALASTGIGILLAVGIDVILGAINGAKEVEQLDSIISDLDSKMKIVNGYLATVNKKSDEITTGAVTQIQTFKDVSAGMLKILPPGHQPNFDFGFPDTIASLDECLAAQQAAISQFGLLIQLRNSYQTALDNGRNPTKAGSIYIVLLTAPPWVTEAILTSIWDDVLAKYSTLMKNAK